jgi:cell division protein FtsA
MEGVVELAEEIFHMPVRVGYPQNVTGMADIMRNPIYATAAGLLHYGAVHPGEAPRMQEGGAGSASWWARLRAWLSNNF